MRNGVQISVVYIASDLDTSSRHHKTNCQTTEHTEVGKVYFDTSLSKFNIRGLQVFVCLHLYRYSDTKHPQWHYCNHQLPAHAARLITDKRLGDRGDLCKTRNLISFELDERLLIGMLLMSQHWFLLKQKLVLIFFYGFDYMETKLLSNRYKPLHNLLLISLPVPHFSLKDLVFLINSLQNDTKT